MITSINILLDLSNIFQLITKKILKHKQILDSCTVVENSNFLEQNLQGLIIDCYSLIKQWWSVNLTPKSQPFEKEERNCKRYLYHICKCHIDWPN